MITPSEINILAVRAAEDPDAFAQLYNICFQRVYNYIRYRSGDRCIAEDLTSRVFERLLVYINKYSSQRGPFEPWLFAIVRNVVNDHYRRQRFPRLPWDALGKQPTREASAEEKLIHQENVDELQEALLKLDPRALDLISLKFFARLTNRQIAKVVHMNESAVGVALFRAVARLREILMEEKEHRLPGCDAKELQDERR